ncbi:MAG: type II toxin-antitoxin system RelE/ParE family toxin [Candidatus Azobacteroides sp.]|nr:type II toxin-antitoxin system RelE/ParE family toxin [Candidatus Azobacteroides sp.]
MKVLWTAFAQTQLEDIYDYIQTQNPCAAAEIYNDILDEAAMLAHFPRIATIEPYLSEFPEEYRSLMVRRNYKVVYYIDRETTVYIVAVFDCRQNPEKLKNIVDINL